MKEVEQHEMLINNLNSESCIDIPNTYKYGKSKKEIEINVSDELTDIILEIYNNQYKSSIEENQNFVYEEEIFANECNNKILKWLINKYCSCYYDCFYSIFIFSLEKIIINSKIYKNLIKKDNNIYFNNF